MRPNKSVSNRITSSSPLFLDFSNHLWILDLALDTTSKSNHSSDLLELSQVWQVWYFWNQSSHTSEKSGQEEQWSLQVIKQSIRQWNALSAGQSMKLTEEGNSTHQPPTSINPRPKFQQSAILTSLWFQSPGPRSMSTPQTNSTKSIWGQFWGSFYKCFTEGSF